MNLTAQTIFPSYIEYECILITFKALHGIGAKYLEELLQWHQASRALRSSSLSQLEVPRTRLKYYEDRSFVKVAPSLWNRLPLKLREMSDLTEF